MFTQNNAFQFERGLIMSKRAFIGGKARDLWVLLTSWAFCFRSQGYHIFPPFLSGEQVYTKGRRPTTYIHPNLTSYLSPYTHLTSSWKWLFFHLLQASHHLPALSPICTAGGWGQRSQESTSHSLPPIFSCSLPPYLLPSLLWPGFTLQHSHRKVYLMQTPCALSLGSFGDL